MKSNQHVRATAMAVGLGALCIVFVVLGIGCSKESPRENSSEALEVSPLDVAGSDPRRKSELEPTAVLVVIRDIGAWWQDCGCSGNAKGGIGRLPALALGASKVEYLFVGRTVLPYNEGAAPLGEKVNLAVPYFVALAAGIWTEMKAVYWLPDELEKEVLGDVDNLAPFRLDAPHLEWNGLELTISETTISVASNSDAVFFLPGAKNKGREVAVVGFWAGSDGITRYSPRLASTIRLADQYDEAREEAMSLLASDSNSKFAFWKTSVNGDLPLDARYESAAETATVSLLHVPASMRAYVGSNASQETIRYVNSSCGKCHEHAVESWSTSRHSRSLDTLAERARETDLRCVSCHTSSYVIKAGRVVHEKGRDAVTCSSCHGTRAAKDSITCTTCHTSAVDPHQRYSRVTGICNGKSDVLAGNCRRE